MTKVSEALMVALKDCAKFPRGNYIWKPKSMEKLAAIGLVEAVPFTGGFFTPEARAKMRAYTPTEAGRAALSETTKERR